MHQTSGNNINNKNNININNMNNGGQIVATTINTIATGTSSSTTTATTSTITSTSTPVLLTSSITSTNAVNPKTLYVGNLDPSINESFIHSLFSSFGKINGLKMINDNQNDLYCFIDYEDHSSALSALAMNQRLLLDRELKVNWASNSSGNTTGQKTDTSKHFHIFVGDLSPEVTSSELRENFSVFGEISGCRIVENPNSSKSAFKYGFISYVRKQDAENAINGMNGQWLGHRAIRTNWATRKMTTLKGTGGNSTTGSNVNANNNNDNNLVIGPNVNNRAMKYDEVYNSSSFTNCTVYCGGIVNGLTEELMQKTFSRFGTIQDIRVFKDKGYAFIKFTCKEAATNAIVYMNNQELAGNTIKCSWGRENLNTITPSTQTNLTAATPLIYPYGHHAHQQQLSYWYQPTAFQTAAAIHAHPQAAGPTATQQAQSIASGSNHHHHHHPHHQTQYTTAVQTNATAGLQYPYNQHQYYSSIAAVAAAAAAGQAPNATNAGFNSSPMAIPITAGWTQPPLPGTFTNNSVSLQLPGSMAAAAAAAAVASGYPTIQGYQTQ